MKLCLRLWAWSEEEPHDNTKCGLPKRGEIMGEKCVYHYCSVEVLLLILQNATLRLSNVEKSNDSSERKHVSSKIGELFHSTIEKSSNLRDTEKLHRLFDDVLTALFTSDHSVFVSCFSSQPDLLSQWRGYANNGTGVAIGFSIRGLNQINSSFGPIFSKVNYSQTQLNEYAQSQAYRMIMLLESGDNLVHAMSEVYANDLQNICLYKNPSFKEEVEWRICYARSFGDHKRKLHREPFDFSEILLASENNKVTAYVNMWFKTYKNSLIKEIILGPKCTITESDMKNVLNYLDYEFRKINVRQSESTYR